MLTAMVFDWNDSTLVLCLVDCRLRQNVPRLVDAEKSRAGSSGALFSASSYRSAGRRAPLLGVHDRVQPRPEHRIRPLQALSG